VATQAFAAEDEGARAQSAAPDVVRVAQASPASGTQSESTSGGLEEVIVTAERRTEDIQHTAASVSVRTGTELAEQGRYTTREILQDIPGVVAVDNSSVNIGSADVQGDNITIRGIAPGAGASAGPSGLSAAPGTAVYVDGVYEGVGSGYDIDRVEVLRGPQGTLYGRSATTGVVAFHTRNPTFDSYGGYAEAEAGNYDLQHYSAAVNLPLNNTLAVRLAGDYHDQGESYYGIGGDGESKRTDGRGKLLWKPNDAFSLLAGFAYEKSEAVSGGNTTTAAIPTLALLTVEAGLSPGLKEQREYWAEANWDVGPFKITYMPTFRDWYQNDHLLVAANFIGSGAPLHQTLLTPRDNFETQELRFSSKDDAAVKWQTGAFYYRNTLTKYNNDFLATPSGGSLAVLSNTADEKSTRDVGVFAETTLPLAASTRATLGVRYDDTQVVTSESFYDDIYALCGTILQFSVLPLLPPGATCVGPGQASVPSPPAASINDVVLTFHNFNYKVRLEQDLTQKNMVYGMVSTGFRPGDAGIANRAPNILGVEKLTSYEVGSKNRFLEDKLQVDADIYYYDYRGVQTGYTNNPFAINGTFAVTVPEHNIGGELEMLYQLTSQDRIGLNYDHVEARWYDKPAGFALAQPETVRAMTPYTITANYEHMFNLAGGSTLTAHIDGEYQAAHLSANLQATYLALGFQQYVYEGARTIGNLSANWASNGGRYMVSAYVRNFTNREYVNYAANGTPNTLNVTWTDPRIYGALVNVRF
jgi:iron complex outermembrane receptor protein